jgi:uncharacterized protein (TIGR02996 family)
MSLLDLALLHRAILLDPGDDLARLAMADALEEAGEDARAEMIRLDIRVARLGVPDGPCKRGCPCGGAGKRVAALVAKHGDEWNPLLPGESPGQLAFGWRRGFVASVRCPLASWLSHGAAMVASHPLEVVEISDREPDHSRAYGDERFGWAEMERCYGSAAVPHALLRRLWKLLPPSPLPHRTDGFAGYPSPKAAVAALSLACLDLFRPECGLPLLGMAPAKHAALAGAAP